MNNNSFADYVVSQCHKCNIINLLTMTVSILFIYISADAIYSNNLTNLIYKKNYQLISLTSYALEMYNDCVTSNSITMRIIYILSLFSLFCFV